MMTDDEIIAVVKAHKEGKEIEGRSFEDREWFSAIPTWNFEVCEYRVKPEPVSAEPVANYIELTTAEALQHLRDRGLVDIDNHEMSGLYKLVINPDWKPSPPE